MTQLITYQTIHSSQIYLNSKHANTLRNDSFNSNVVFNLKDPVVIDKNTIELRLSLVNAQIPHSFYQLNSSNNCITIIVSEISTTYYFPVGNYSVSSFIDAWNNLVLGTWALTYTSLTNKLTFGFSTTFSFTDTSGNSIFPIIGFQTNTVYTSSSNSLTAPYCYNFNGISRINIVSSTFSVRNIDSFNDGQSDIIASIPVNAYPSGIILYTNFTNYKSTIAHNDLSTLGIQIIDDEENLIDFNGVDWTMTFQIDLVKEIIYDSRTLHEIYDEEQDYLNEN